MNIFQRLFTGVLAATLSLGTAGVAYEQWAQYQEQDHVNPPGQLVDLGETHLHLDCRGEAATPTIVLEAGALGWSSTWAHIQDNLAQDYRVCTYDRPGLGWSSPTHASADAGTAVVALHQALEKAGESGSYVLVGHSYGAMVIRAYANRYPDQVAAMVMVDGSHPDQFERLPTEFVARARQFITAIPVLANLAPFGIVRLANLLPNLVADLPQAAYEAAQHFGASRRHLQRAADEYAAWTVSADLAKENQTYGHLPLLVMSAGVLPDAEPGDLEAIQSLHRELATLSTNSHYTVIPQADHYSLLANPDHAEQVSQGIRLFLGTKIK